MRRHFVFLVMLAALLLGACQPVMPPTSVPSTDSASESDPLAGTEWLLTQMQGQQLVHDTAVTARFGDDESLEGRAACNEYATSYSTDGADLTIDPNFDTGTEVCGEVWMTVQSVYLASLQAVTAYEIQGEVLFLRDGEGTVTAEDYKQLVPEVEALTQKYPDGVFVLIDLQEFAGEQVKAWLPDLKFGHQYHDKIAKMAIVGDKRWEKWLTSLVDPFYAKEGKYFHSDDIDEAWAWLREEQ